MLRSTILAALLTLAPATSALAQADPHADHMQMMQPAADGAHAGHGMAGMAMDEPGFVPPRAAVAKPAAMSTSAGDGVTVATSATSVTIGFDHAVVVAAVTLTNAVGQRFPIPATLADVPVASLSAPLIRLPSGTYTLAWRTTDSGAFHSGTRTFVIRDDWTKG